MIEIRIAQTDDEIIACFPVIRQLRTHLIDSEFVPRIKTQQLGGYRLCYLTDGESVRSVAGCRLIENLFSGRVLYVDDLVTDGAARSQGYGRKMLEWLTAEAKASGCDTLELDSGVQRFDAHRFYLQSRMIISSHHFRLVLK